MSTYDWEIFDFDGTLADSMSSWAAVNRQLCRDFGIDDEKATELIIITLPLPEKEDAEVFQKAGVKLTIDEIIMRKRVFMREAYLNRIPFKPGALEYLTRLHDRGARLAICSSTQGELLEAALTRLGVRGWIEHIWSATDLNSSKSDIALYERITRELGCPPERVRYYDDSIHAITAAKAAGFVTVGVYDAASDSRQEELRATAKYYVNRLDELTEAD